MPTPVQKQAVRRVPLEFDENGDPVFRSVTSPECFKPHALGILPPRHVIPIIFVPGIMGTNLCANGSGQKEGAAAWIPPNGNSEGVSELRRRLKQKPAERQKQMTSDRVKVDNSRKVELPRDLYTLTEDEARRRGWGEVHFDSYGTWLPAMEIALNDQRENPGTAQSCPLPEWVTAMTLRKSQGDQFEDVLPHWNPVKGSVTALTRDEFARLDDYYYPVWACGYNWLASCEDGSELLLKRIHDALDWYDKSHYFITEGRVIVVTHSMGGLVARRAAQKAPELILGVVHGVQPVTGAPVVYRRFRAGTEADGLFDLPAAFAATIIGWDAADVTCVLGNSPGPLELLPTQHYPPGWLQFEQHRDGKITQAMPPLPVADPYAEIYAKSVQDVWWGMVDETLIDPANLAPKNKTAFTMYGDALTTAKSFHDNVKLDCHPNTYAYYGSDSEQVAFGRVRWVTNDVMPDQTKMVLPSVPAARVTNTGKAIVAATPRAEVFNLADRESPRSDNDPNAGDATVPRPSGEKIKAGASLVFKMKGFDHQMSYKDANVQDVSFYCIAKIIQTAKPAKDLPQSKGGVCG